jgi:hypothetical protein
MNTLMILFFLLLLITHTSCVILLLRTYVPKSLKFSFKLFPTCVWAPQRHEDDEAVAIFFINSERRERERERKILQSFFFLLNFVIEQIHQQVYTHNVVR